MAAIRTAHLFKLKPIAAAPQLVGATPLGETGDRPPEGPVYDVFEVL